MQKRGMCQARRDKGVLRSGVSGEEDIGWVQLTLTFLWTSVDRRSSSFHSGYLEWAVW